MRIEQLYDKLYADGQKERKQKNRHLKNRVNVDWQYFKDGKSKFWRTLFVWTSTDSVTPVRVHTKNDNICCDTLEAIPYDFSELFFSLNVDTSKNSAKYVYEITTTSFSSQCTI